MGAGSSSMPSRSPPSGSSSSFCIIIMLLLLNSGHMEGAIAISKPSPASIKANRHRRKSPFICKVPSACIQLAYVA